MAMRLTAAITRALALPPGKLDHVFFDSDLPGFGLRVRATGAKTWMVQYAIAGRTRRIVLGSTAVLDPGKARETAKDLLAKIRLGADPAREKTEARTRAAETFGVLLPRFLDRQRARLKPRSLVGVIRHLAKHAKPLHSHAVEAIDRRTIATRLAEITKASGPAESNRVRNSLSAYFTWLAREGYVENNPVAFTNKAVENGPRDRVPTDAELATIWCAVGDDPHYGAIVKLLMLSGARRDEIASLCWSEVDFDAATITLPPARTKNKREHVIPLSELALAILKAQPLRLEADGTPRDLIFGHGKRGYQGWSASKVKLDARIAATRQGEPLDWRLHDFRRSLSTALHERFSVPPHVVEATLGHAGGHKGGVAGIYNKALYLDERRRALERWAEHIKAIVSRKPGKAKVVHLRRGKGAGQAGGSGHAVHISAQGGGQC
jgi:integrase